jgi:regulator of protease activity HflC (stomatin/prohibitin superfamily)
LDAQVWRELGVMALALALLGWVVMRNRVRHVPRHHVEIIERLGRYHRTAGPGRHVLLPLDAFRKRLDMREHTHITRSEPAVTADNVWVSVKFLIRYRIADPVRFTYEAIDALFTVTQFALMTVRNELAGMDLAQARDERPDLARRVREQVRTQAPQWGIELIDLDVEDVETTAEGGAGI